MEIGVRGRRTRPRDFGADGGTTSTAVKRRRLFDDNKDEEWGVSLPEKGFSREFVSRDFDFQRPETRADGLRFVEGDRRHSPSSSVLDPGAASVSCCSSYRSSEKGKERVGIVDLEEVAADVQTTHLSCKNRGTGGVHSNTKRSDAPDESPATVESRRRSISDKKKQMVTETELEDLFSAAEKERHNKLLECTKKYNFDFSKEEPLEGRYEWVRLKK